MQLLSDASVNGREARQAAKVGSFTARRARITQSLLMYSMAVQQALALHIVGDTALYEAFNNNNN